MNCVCVCVFVYSFLSDSLSTLGLSLCQSWQRNRETWVLDAGTTYCSFLNCGICLFVFCCFFLPQNKTIYTLHYICLVRHFLVSYMRIWQNFEEQTSIKLIQMLNNSTRTNTRYERRIQHRHAMNLLMRYKHIYYKMRCTLDIKASFYK